MEDLQHQRLPQLAVRQAGPRRNLAVQPVVEQHNLRRAARSTHRPPAHKHVARVGVAVHEAVEEDHLPERRGHERADRCGVESRSAQPCDVVYLDARREVHRDHPLRAQRCPAAPAAVSRAAPRQPAPFPARARQATKRGAGGVRTGEGFGDGDAGVACEVARAAAGVVALDSEVELAQQVLLEHCRARGLFVRARYLFVRARCWCVRARCVRARGAHGVRAAAGAGGAPGRIQRISTPGNPRSNAHAAHCTAQPRAQARPPPRGAGAGAGAACMVSRSGARCARIHLCCTWPALLRQLPLASRRKSLRPPARGPGG